MLGGRSYDGPIIAYYHSPSAIKTYAVLSIGGKNSVHAGKTYRPFVTGSG